MNEFLSQSESAPSISNPAMLGENFDRHWKNDAKGYSKLKVAIRTYAGIASTAVAMTDMNEATRHWKKLFGEEFLGGKDGVRGTGFVTEPTIIGSPSKAWCNVT